MYAVFETGGKQYKASQGDTLKVEKLAVAEGDAVDFDKVFMISDGESINIGAPTVAGGKVSAVVKAHGRAKKIKIVKFQRRKHSKKQMGHRQHFTEIEITQVSAG